MAVASAQAERVRRVVARWLPRRRLGGHRLDTMGTINGALTSPAVGLEQPALARFGPVVTSPSPRGETDQRSADRRERVSADAAGDAAAPDDVERELLGV